MANDLISDEDKALFRDHMRTVKPLNEKTKKNTSLVSPSRELPLPSKKRSDAHTSKNTKINKKEYFLSDFITEEVLSDSVMSYCIAIVPNKRFRELKNGQIPWEARLDLHGLKTEAAREALCHFINAQTHLNKRCLLIIHGKGGHQGAPPVIKNLINRWLPQFEEILAFHSAQAKDGGRGAVYVLLKNKGY